MLLQGETDGTRPRNIATNDEFLDTIKLSLDNEYVVMGDVAIGEPPTGTKQEVNGKMIEWYGFVRLIVLVRASHPLSKDYTSFKTVIAPFGDKQSMYEPHVYPKDASPDKGGVCVVIESLDLVIVCCHLYGTNKYGVPEKTFDAKRRFQLRHMSEMFQYYLPPGRLSNMNKIVLGDFNFRAEMHPDPEDKVKGGRDWQSVQSHLSKDWKGGSKEDKDTGVRRLFHRHDRLNTWMVKSGVWEEDETYGEGAGEEQDTEERENDEVEFGLSEGVPEVLLNTSDAIAEARGEFCYPTFTFKIGDKKVPREYAEKRTPSWTDRVIYGGALTLRDVGVERKVIASDHEPVYATFLLKQATT
ncbi:hypothetical protein TeGR_g895 [Tetraparma gracilis]|uniref:Uncharacterized protein n=1 Tax=Tetraparma gracilis TaxID=2962635 RepID=A0ABQ6N8S7_9STRA|nr:hypothetical protein TeGR_g895 [Tetraparma gracilis]